VKNLVKDKKIRISLKARAALTNLKRGGETYDDVIVRLINLWILVPLDLEFNVARELQNKAAEAEG